MQSKIYLLSFLLTLLFFFFSSNDVLAQENQRRFYVTNPSLFNGQDKIITITDLVLLRINPDVRTSGLGETGIAISPDLGALYHNVSKLAFVKRKTAISLTHVPSWMPQFTNKAFFSNLSGYKRLNDKQTIGVSFRYFSLGAMNISDIDFFIVHPVQYAIDIGYARKLSDKLSIGITLKHAISDIDRKVQLNASSLFKNAKTIAIDLGIYHQNPTATFLGKKAIFSWGVTLSNIGNKTAYTENQIIKNFIPSNLGIGTAIDTKLSDKHQLMFTMDINKLLVPSPNPNDPTLQYHKKSAIGGILGSFTDAPNGLEEELQELLFSIGMEYTYNHFLTVRLGHFNEHELKGNRQYLTTGLGIRYKALELNGAYLMATSSNKLLDRTLRLQLNVGFGKEG